MLAWTVKFFKHFFLHLEAFYMFRILYLAFKNIFKHVKTCIWYFKKDENFNPSSEHLNKSLMHFIIKW